MKRDNKEAMKDEQRADTAEEALLRKIVSAFIQFPDAILIDTEKSGQRELMTLEVHQEDYPRVFGSQSKNIEALRTLFRFIGDRDGRDIRLMLMDSKRGERGLPAPFVPNRNWKSAKTVELLRTVLGRVLRMPFNVDAVTREGTTNIDITATESERDTLGKLIPYLQPIFHAIGKNEGQKIYLFAVANIPVHHATI